ncbi:MAG: triose-phosphate isomerase, partial [Candidatus Omnitrophica bacterium]|nr:triose-phosphate isomerase [Candidatus Omnitrophota bacterium]
MKYPVRILGTIFFLISLPNLGLESLRRIKNLPSLEIELNNRRFLQVGAQRVVTQQGAFTDRTFIGDAKEAGANFSLVYHSEIRGDYVSDARRLGKSVDEVINSEVKALLNNGMTPVICVGETETEKKGGKTREVVKKQVLSALEGLDPKTVANIVIAYEPLWAVTRSGSGIPATPH